MANIGGIERGAIFAEEDFVVETQAFLHRLMEEKGVSRSDLARSMGVSRARVSQIFSDECKNFTVRLLARAIYALGEAPMLQCKGNTEVKIKLLDPEDIEAAWKIKGMLNDIKNQLPCNDRLPARLTGYSYLNTEWEAA